MSRRKAEELIRQGRVTVDGVTATIGVKIDADRATVRIDGVRLPVRPGAVYYLLYKPVGVITTTADTHGRQTVIDLVPAEPTVHPVGRLDADSEGLLVLTNDGALTNHVTHPRYGVTKTYVALVTGRLPVKAARRLVSGVEIDDGLARAVSARIVDIGGAGTLVEIVMNEGRNREVRRMVAAVGHDVLRLVRTGIGPIRDTNLEPGTWRSLTGSEVRVLFAIGHQPTTAESPGDGA